MSRKILNFAIGAQIVLGSLWTYTWAATAGNGDFGMLPFILLVYAVQLVGFLIGAVICWIAPDLRRRAYVALALPVVFLFLPGMVQSLAGGYLSRDESLTLLLIIGALLLAACVFAPRSVAKWMPGALRNSGLFNGIVFAGVAAGWLVIIGIFIWLIAGSGGGYQGDTGYGLAYAIVLGAVYFAGLGLASLFAATWGWIGLRSGPDNPCRSWNIAQMVVSAPGLIAGGLALAFLLSQQLF